MNRSEMPPWEVSRLHLQWGRAHRAGPPTESLCTPWISSSLTLEAVAPLSAQLTPLSTAPPSGGGYVWSSVGFALTGPWPTDVLGNRKKKTQGLSRLGTLCWKPRLGFPLAAKYLFLPLALFGQLPKPRNQPCPAKTCVPLDYRLYGIQWGNSMRGPVIPCLRLSAMESCGQQESS